MDRKLINKNRYAQSSPQDIRRLIREGKITSQTSGMHAGRLRSDFSFADKPPYILRRRLRISVLINQFSIHTVLL